MSTPVLLQRILLAMESPVSSRRQALIFALLSLLVRLVSTQSSILGIWFGRRCYERSRGEMITMIFEKTLGRKLIAAPKKLDHDESMNGDSQKPISKGTESLWNPAILVVKARRAVYGFFGSSKKPQTVQEPASMGKILNLMRFV